MKNQFIYTETSEITDEKGEKKSVAWRATFNLEKVIRSVEIPTGEVIVILDDFHEDWVVTPITVNPNTDRVVKNKRERAAVQSEIKLSKEDGERFLLISEFKN